MTDENRKTLRYRVLRYTPNLVRDEWVNIGVFLEEVDGPRREARLIQEPGELARVRRLHPAADELLLRSLPVEFDARLAQPSADVRQYLEKLELTLSNVVQFSPQRAVLAEDFDAEMDRLYRDHVTPPARLRAGVMESTRAWIRERLRDVFRRHRLTARLEKNIRVDEFTQPGDPLKLDYAYQNGVRGYLHSIVLGRDLAQAKVLAYTAECIRGKIPNAEFTAITEIEPSPDNPRHVFMSRVFSDQNINIVSLNRIERFADDLKRRLQ
jgi:hypothetical protein